MRDLPTIPSLLVVLLACSATAAGVGCATPPVEEEAESTSSEAQKAPSKPVWPADRQKLVAENYGGGMAIAPEGSTCMIGTGKYTLDLGTRGLTWSVCQSAQPLSPWRVSSGSRVLSATEVATIDSAMQDVEVSSEDLCWEDMPMRTIAVTARLSTESFVDESVRCGRAENGAPITNIDGVFDALEKLAR